MLYDGERLVEERRLEDVGSGGSWKGIREALREPVDGETESIFAGIVITLCSSSNSSPSEPEEPLSSVRAPMLTSESAVVLLDIEIGWSGDEPAETGEGSPLEAEHTPGTLR